ncbi:anthrone oxygenase family protein [Streptomyces candidus]|uniref:Putative membrane protein n=1 Tax=Streptomyces candidus TaxID=67283 RepID=A0A7X0HG87_9ACTN|nr:anthrone oxygenase family protein [Streptomyces candidus]MBB6437079.1 putative membrane protein [Streptomyces candidus]GHH32892.1 membrane protein [Streptomyces candidus]
MSTLLLALAVVSTGLYAGMMLIFRTGIMPALARVPDAQFVNVMRRINEDVPRGLFVLTMFASVGFPLAVLFVAPDGGRTGVQLWLLAGGLALSVVNHGITAGGNVPLNNALASSESAGTPDGEVRAAFETRWNRLHTIRTLCAVVAFALVTASAAGWS